MQEDAFMLDYFLELNALTRDNPKDIRTQTANVLSYNQASVIECSLKSGAGLTRSDVISVLEAQKQGIYDILTEGGAVTTDLFNTFPSIQGVFTGAEDAFDHTRHPVKIHLSEGIGLRAVEKQVKTKKILPLQTGSVNRLLTPGRNLRINGGKFKITGDDPVVGVYFTGAGGEVKVDETNITENKPSEGMVLIPALAPGEYYVKLVATGSTKPSKSLHTARFETTVTA
jgi:hypothetical protein